MGTKRWPLLACCMFLTVCVMGIIQCSHPTSTALPRPSGPLPTTTALPSSGASSTAPPASSPTPSPIPSPTPIPSPVAINSSTPLPTATEKADVGPVIHYFRTNVEEADPGDTIVLEWESSGGTAAVLYHLPPSGHLPQSGWEVAPTGVYSREIPSDARNWSWFLLYVHDQAGRGTQESLAVRLGCPVPWFFAPTPDVCPTAPILSDAAEQHFERGTMIWIKEPWAEWVQEEEWVIVLYDDQQWTARRWAVFRDEWHEGEADHDPTLTPPDGLYQPVRGFGLVWRQYPEVREQLGWAIDQETGFRTIVQHTTRLKYNSVYLRALDGNVWHLWPERSGWERIAVMEE